MQIYNLEFTEQEIREAVAADRLLSTEIEFSRACNFRCSYCYVPEANAWHKELSREEIKDVILQAKALGARKIIILGGEPSIYPQLVEMLRFLAKRDLRLKCSPMVPAWIETLPPSLQKKWKIIFYDGIRKK